MLVAVAAASLRRSRQSGRAHSKSAHRIPTTREHSYPELTSYEPTDAGARGAAAVGWSKSSLRHEISFG
jgi:hypothetical protein